MDIETETKHFNTAWRVCSTLCIILWKFNVIYPEDHVGTGYKFSQMEFNSWVRRIYLKDKVEASR